MAFHGNRKVSFQHLQLLELTMSFFCSGTAFTSQVEIQLQTQVPSKLTMTFLVDLLVVGSWVLFFMHAWPRVLGFVRIPSCSGAHSRLLFCFPGHSLIQLFPASSFISLYELEDKKAKLGFLRGVGASE